MKLLNIRPQDAAIALIAMAGVAAMGRFWSTFATPTEATRKYQVNLIAQEAAYPGKVIHIRGGGNSVGEYRCTSADAAIAVLSIHDAGGGYLTAPKLGDATDPDKHTYHVVARACGDFCVLSLRSGFSRKPSFVEVPILPDMRGSTSEIRFTKFAEPVRVLQPVSPAQELESSKFGALAYDESQKHLRYSSAFRPTENEFRLRHLLATSYRDGADAENGLHEINWLDADYYQSDTDEVQVCVDRFRYRDSKATLTYKDAQIVERHGHRILVLPTLQNVGQLAENQAFIPKQIPTQADSKAPSSVGRGYILICTKLDPRRLELGAPRANQFPGLTRADYAKVQFLGISPSLEEMGLDKLRIVLNGSSVVSTPLLGFEEIDTFSHKTPGSHLAKIPELKIRLLVRTPYKISSTTLLFPVRHTQAKESVASSGSAIPWVVTPKKLLYGGGVSADLH